MLSIKEFIVIHVLQPFLTSPVQVPAFLNVTDIAGLVKGASEGQGLGNAFLSHIRVSNTNTSDVSIIR